ncbi:hypothetical protein MRB53_035532 [Persea americana]|uniref:Uncharacterized protein n=1 Tax=Persea americana TaxID=3435 RepID=A0ACC2K4X7_PERAE|nr:hypothetical protein MRB53_035532 [Persea americana]
MKAKGPAAVGAHLEEEGSDIAIGGEAVLVGVGWGGRRELVQGDDEGEDDKSADEGLHLEAALGQGGGGGSFSVFSHRCNCFAFKFLRFRISEFQF